MTAINPSKDTQEISLEIFRHDDDESQRLQNEIALHPVMRFFDDFSLYPN